MNRITTETVLLALLALVLIALEIVSAYLAYETMGAVASTLYFLAIGINLVFLLVAIRKPRVAAVGMVLLALAVVPYQFALAQRLWRAQTEAARIVTFAYEQKLATGEYPANLADYRYHDPEMKTYIQQSQGDADVGAFVLCYRGAIIFDLKQGNRKNAVTSAVRQYINRTVIPSTQWLRQGSLFFSEHSGKVESNQPPRNQRAKFLLLV